MQRVSMENLRYANIGIAVCVAITISGVLIFKDSGEAALELVGFVSFVSALAVFLILSERARRRKERRLQ